MSFLENRVREDGLLAVNCDLSGASRTNSESKSMRYCQSNAAIRTQCWIGTESFLASSIKASKGLEDAPLSDVETPERLVMAVGILALWRSEIE